MAAAFVVVLLATALQEAEVDSEHRRRKPTEEERRERRGISLLDHVDALQGCSVGQDVNCVSTLNRSSIRAATCTCDDMYRSCDFCMKTGLVFFCTYVPTVSTAPCISRYLVFGTRHGLS